MKRRTKWFRRLMRAQRRQRWTDVESYQTDVVEGRVVMRPGGLDVHGFRYLRVQVTTCNTSDKVWVTIQGAR